MLNESLVLDGVELNPLPVAPYTNLVINPSFEIGTTGWAATHTYLTGGATLSRTTAQAQSGIAALSIVTTAATNIQGAVAALPAVTGGLPLVGTVYLKGAGGELIQVFMADPAGDVGPITAVTLTTGWQRVTCTWTPSADRTAAVLCVRTSQAVAAQAVTFYLDAAQVVQGTSAPPYFDGGTPGYVWTGTPHASTSAPIPFSLEDISFPTPKKRSEWVQGADADGGELVRDPLFENRTIPAVVRVTAATRDLVDDGVALLVSKCEEAEKQPGGLPLVWTPANSTKSMTFYVLSGEVGDIPVTIESGYFANSVVVPLTLTCKPSGYGPETLYGTASTAGTPLITLAVSGVAGDIPAEARIVVTDMATQSRRDVIWGLEQRYYNAAAPVLLQASDLVTAGFAGAATVIAGSYGTGNPVGAGVAGQPSALCGTGDQLHVGTFRVRARVWSGSTVVRIRLAWQDGDGPFGANSWVAVPAANAWCEVDLGPINVDPAKLGSQRWTGRVEAYTTDGVAQSTYVNLLEIIPAGEGYGRARATYAYKPGSLVARDDFAGFASGALNARTAPLGGAWTTTGAAGDFTGNTPAHFGGGNNLYRATIDAATGRYGVLGSALTDTEVSVRVEPYVYLSNNDSFLGVVARYVDVNNSLRAYINTKQGIFAVSPLIANASSAYVVSVPSLQVGGGTAVRFRLRLIVYASGSVYATLMTDAGATIATIVLGSGQVAALAPGGALASGKAGIFDMGLGTPAYGREYSDFNAAVPPAEPIVMFSGRKVEFRSDGQQRSDAAGTYYGRPPAYRGSPMYVPPAGDQNRTSRIVVAARRNDTDVTTDGGVTDSTKVELYTTPRYVAVPH